jgi:hypothetical protein
MGKAGKKPLRLRSDGRLKLEFHGARVTSGAPEPRAVLNIEEDGLAQEGAEAAAEL